MITIAYFLDIIKLAAAGLIVFFTAWLYIRAFLNKRYNYQLLALRKEGLQHTLPLRLQAYERVILFLERIDPANMLVRLHVSGMSAAEMQNIILADIRAEYQHNVSQQIYVSQATWNTVKKIRDDTISMVSSAVRTLPENASAGDLSRSVLMHLAALEQENPYEIALDIVKQDVRSLF